MLENKYLNMNIIKFFQIIIIILLNVALYINGTCINLKRG